MTDWTAPEQGPRRHSGLETLCGHLEAMLWGGAAAAVLASTPADQLADRSDALTLVTLPAWDWRLPCMAIGRKGVEHGTGEALLMPVRLDWGGNDALVRLVPQDQPETEFSWTACSMGWSDSGDVQLSHFEKVCPETELVSILMPRSRSAAGTGRTMGDQLRELVRDGHQSQWQLLFSLEPFITSTVRKAHAAVSHEIGEARGGVAAVLHETGIEHIVNTMMLGESSEGTTGGASVPRLLEHCLQPDRFAKVDPLMYLRRNLRRDAEDLVRRAIGDPRIGPKIRRLAATMPGATVDEVVAAYRREHPQDRLSLARAEAALSVGPDPMARSVLLDPETNGSAR